MSTLDERQKKLVDDWRTHRWDPIKKAEEEATSDYLFGEEKEQEEQLRFVIADNDEDWIELDVYLDSEISDYPDMLSVRRKLACRRGDATWQVLAPRISLYGESQ